MMRWAIPLLWVGLATVSCSTSADKPAASKAPPPGRDAGAGDTGDTGIGGSRPERIVIDRVQLQLTPSLRGSKASADGDRRLAQLFAEALVVTSWFVHEAGAVPATHRARHAVLQVLISHDIAAGDKRRRVARVAFESRVVWADGGSDPAPGENVAIERRLGDGETGSMADLLAAMVRRIADSLAAKERVRSGGAAALQAGLAAEQIDLDLQLWALALVRDNRRSDGYDGAVGLLASESRDVRDAAVGALIGLGQPRAMKAIAQATDTKDTASVLLSVEAAGSLGGDEAHSYLEFLIDGHASARVLAAARRALLRITPPAR